VIKNNIVAMYAKWFNDIPLRERDHWYRYQIQKEEAADR
jgi:hypothetical protein